MFAPPVAQAQTRTNTFLPGAPARHARTLAGNKPGAQSGREAAAGISSALASSGEALDAVTRTFMEPRLGRNLGAVRIHRDETAANSARAQGALAYAVGRDLVFGAGQYAPHTPEGRKLLAHELTHSVQQNLSSSHFSAAPPPEADAAIESEANRSADSLARGRSFRPTLRAAPGVACQHDPGIITQDPFANEIVGEAERGRGIHFDEANYEETTPGHFSLIPARGTENYAVVRTTTEARVVVRINLVWAEPPQDTYNNSFNIERWRNGITSAWNGRFGLTNGATSLPIVFEPIFTGENAHHRVRVHEVAAPQAGQPPPNTRANETDWFETNNGLTAAHEFGHMLGNLDEANLPASNNEIPRRFPRFNVSLSENDRRRSNYRDITGESQPSHIHGPGYTVANSIMSANPESDPSTSIPHARHVQNILNLFNRRLRQPHEARFHIAP